MRSFSRRLGLAVAFSAVLVISVVGVVSADIESKSINTELGECTVAGDPDCNSAAVYHPTLGFTGQLFFTAAQVGTTVRVADYICVHETMDGPFLSFGGSYTLTIMNAGATIGTDAYTVTADVLCSDANFAVTATEGATFTVPADGTVEYSIFIAGVEAGADAQATFAAYNSIRNRAVETTGGTFTSHADSESVKPPTSFIIPEAPLTILLVVTAGLGMMWFVGRRMRPHPLGAG